MLSIRDSSCKAGNGNLIVGFISCCVHCCGLQLPRVCLSFQMHHNVLILVADLNSTQTEIYILQSTYHY